MKIPRLTTSSFLPAIIACAGLLAASSHAATLVNDNFTNSSGTDVGIVNNTEAAGVGTYTTIQPASATGMSVTTLSGFGSGNVLSLANNTNTYYRAFDGNATLTLSGLAVNETLSMKYSVRFDGSFTGADNYSFGFVNTTSPNSILYANVDLNSDNLPDSEFRYRAGSFNMSDAGSIINGTQFNSTKLTSGASYTMELSITRLASSYVIAYYLNGVQQASFTQATNSAWAVAEADAAITGIAFRHSQVPQVTTYIDNVLVTVVPEPGTIGLLLGGLGFLFFGRRLISRRDTTA